MIIAGRWRLSDVKHFATLPLFLLFAWDMLVASLYVLAGQRWVALNDLPMSLIGSALALLVTLRNNIAYARWWEARQLWGGVLNSSRSLARQVVLYVSDAAAQRSLVDLQVAYAQALRCHLRKQDPWDEIARLTTPDVRERLRAASNIPNAILIELADQLRALQRTGALDTVQLAAFDGTMAVLGNMQGGAERIKNTPLPREYTLLPTVFVQLFCLLLPLAMVSDLGLATPLGSTLVGFLFLALDRVGMNLADPFENTIHDVPLSSISRTIEIDLRQSVGRTDVPPSLKPADGILW